MSSIQKTLLIADDEQMIRELFREAFESEGLKVLEAPNGREAFELVKKNKVDVVVTDMRMANGDGPELAKNIKAMTGAKPKVFIISGHTLPDTPELQDLDIVKIFSKPFDFTEIIKDVLAAVS